MATTAPVLERNVEFPPLAALDDAALAARVADGDERAFEELYRRHAGPLYRYCASIVGNPHEAEEALQSAMFKAYRELRRPGRPMHVRAWLYRVAHNGCLDIVRRRRETDGLTGLEEERGLDVEGQVALREDLRQLRRDLDALATEQRSALLLREMGGLSHLEIGQALDSTPATAKQLIHDARRNLAAFETGRSQSCDEVRHAISDRDGRVLRGAGIRGHLRACPDCAAFRADVRDRGRRLEALFPPLAPVAAKGILASVVGAGGGSGGGALLAGGAGGGALAGGLVAQVAVIGAAVVVGTMAVGLPLGLAERISGSDRPTVVEAPQTRIAPSPGADDASLRPTRPGTASGPAAPPRRAPQEGRGQAAPKGDEAGHHRPAQEAPKEEEVIEVSMSAESLGADALASGDPAAAGTAAATRAAARLRAALSARAVSMRVKGGPASATVNVSRSGMPAAASVTAGPVAAGVIVGHGGAPASLQTPVGAVGPSLPTP